MPAEPSAAGRIVSVNVGQPREVVWGGRRVTTGIYKSPVAGPVVVRPLGLEGDGQADPRFHGGAMKAVYAYPSEHYPKWQRELSRDDLGWGAFGENLTTEGLLEDEVRIGDRFKAGSAWFQVTQPRVPCFKLGNKFGSMEFVQQFARAGRPGFYLAVVRGGQVQAGDTLRRTHASTATPTIAEQFAAMLGTEEEAEG